MIDARAQEMLKAAARAARERLHSGREKASPELRPYLEHVDRHLFDVDYGPGALRRAFGLPPRSRKLHQLFRRELKCGIKEYLVARRMETAKRLLLDTDLKIWRISLLVGYHGQAPFQKAFKAHCGETPRMFRVNGRPGAAARPPAVDEATNVRHWRAAVVGALPQSAAREWIARLEARYPTAAVEPRSPLAPDSETRRKVTIRGSEDADLFARAIWDALRELPHTLQRRLVREQVAFETPALFDLLLEKSREEGREDRRRRLELAELALESLEGSAETLGEELPKYRARGWAWVGNARRLAGDFFGAEDAFISAAAEGEAADAESAVQIAVEIYNLKANLRLSQRRFPEAVALNEKAINICRAAQIRPLLIRSLMLRAAICDDGGDGEGNIKYLREAIGLIDTEGDPRLAVILYVSLMNSYLAAGANEQAAAIRPKVKALCAAHGGRRERYHLQWIEGRHRLAEGDLPGAEKMILDAYSGLVALGAQVDAAAAGMDLATVYLKQHRPGEALAVVSAAAPVFERLKITREAFAALALLRKAMEGNEIKVTTVEVLRSCLKTARLASMDLLAVNDRGKERAAMRSDLHPAVPGPGRSRSWHDRSRDQP